MSLNNKGRKEFPTEECAPSKPKESYKACFLISDGNCKMLYFILYFERDISECPRTFNY